MSTDTLHVVTENLVRRFGEIEAVAGIDIAVEPGEIYGFLGPNGAGKTTTIRMLTTLLRPTSGRAWVAGYDVAADPDAVRRSIGVALQDAAIDPLMTGRELLRLQAVLHGIGRKAADERGGVLLDMVGLSGAADRRVATYSGGMRRRLDLALSLVHQPKVLFLDEPTTGLDPNSRFALWGEVKKLNRDGTTVFLTTQYMEEADELSGRIAIIDNGSIVAEGTPRELKAKVGVPTLLVTTAGQQDPATLESILKRFGELVPGTDRDVGVRLEGGASGMAAVVRALDGAGLAVESLELHTPTLDDVFQDATGHRLEGAEPAGAEPAEAAPAESKGRSAT